MYSILVCDDEKDIVSALRIYLTSEGYRVYEAYDGKEALEILEREEIHLVIMDIMMPVLDGMSYSEEKGDAYFDKNFKMVFRVPKNSFDIRKYLADNLERANIQDGRVPHSILIELLSDRGIGTMFS